jgi:hypothetical protein
MKNLSLLDKSEWLAITYNKGPFTGHRALNIKIHKRTVRLWSAILYAKFHRLLKSIFDHTKCRTYWAAIREKDYNDNELSILKNNVVFYGYHSISAIKINYPHNYNSKEIELWREDKV